MIEVDISSYKDKIEDAYSRKCWKENQEYLDKHGVGPYEYNGRFADRTVPYLDAGYWRQYELWLYDEFKAVIHEGAGGRLLEFEDEKDAMMFILRWT